MNKFSFKMKYRFCSIQVLAQIDICVTLYGISVSAMTHQKRREMLEEVNKM